MIVALSPGGVVAQHIDQGGYAEVTDRYHWIIQTNPAAWMQCADERITPKAGEVWFFDKHVMHSCGNGGDQDRVHLIFDVLPC